MTLVTTHLNSLLFADMIQREKESGFEIRTQVIKFPAAEAGLPEGCENASSITCQEMTSKFIKAVNLLQQPLQQLLEELRPDYLVADGMFPWATDIASNVGIPRLVFHGTSCFAQCVADSLKRHEPFKKVASESEIFYVPGLPDQIKMTRLQLLDYVKETEETDRKGLINESIETELTSYGVLVNSFYELEPAYTKHYSQVLGRKAWYVGPVSLCNKNSKDKAERGNPAAIINDEHKCCLTQRKQTQFFTYVFEVYVGTETHRNNQIM